MKRGVFSSFILAIGLIYVIEIPCYGFWVWTPQTKKWVNPKYAAKETPQKQFDYAMDFFEKGNYEKAAEEFERLIRSYPTSSLAPEAGYYGGLSYQRCELYYKAHLIYNKMITQYPHSKRISQIVENEYRIGNIFLEGKRRKILGVEILPALNTAKKIFEGIVENLPYSEYGDDSQYKLGLVYKKMNNYQEAVEAFERVVKNYPQSALKEKAKYQIAFCLLKSSLPSDYDQETTDKAIEKFEDFISGNPPTDLAEEAKEAIKELKNRKAKHEFDIAKYYEDNNKYQAAIIYYESIIKNYPQTEWAKVAEEKLKNIKKK